MSAMTCLKALLWFVCLSHLAMGASLNLVPDAVPILAKYYGAKGEFPAEFVYIVKPLGAFMMTLGFVGIAAAWNPLKHGSMIYGFAILFLLRSAQRIVYAEEIEKHLGIAPGRNWMTTAFFLVLAVALVALYRTAAKASKKL